MNANTEGTTLKLKKFLDPKAPRPVEESNDTIMIVRDAVNQATSDPRTLPSAEPAAVRTKSLLGILAYCYAKGTYASADIAEKLQRSLGTNDTPDAKGLRRFRRLHREVLQAALERSLRLIRRATIRRTMSQTLPGSEPATSALATAKPDPAPSEGTTFIARRDAQQKLDNAAIIDTTLDD